MSFPARHLLRIVAGSLLFSTTLWAFGSPEKQPIPDPAAQQNAQKLVQEVFGEELARAKSAPDRASLAGKMLHEAAVTNDNPASRYVLLTQALDMAAKAGDLKTAFAAIDEIDRGWNTDTIKLRADALAKLAPAIRDSTERLAFIHDAQAVVDQGIAQDRYQIAREVNALALASAGPTRDAALVKQLTARAGRITELAAAYNAIEPSLAALRKNGSDPSANLAVGKFECFMKGNWQAGLPKLAIGSDPQIQALAIKDRAGVNTAETQTDLGDAWWDLGEHESATAQVNIRLRAAAWYAKAAPHLTGLMQIKAQTREKQAMADGLQMPDIVDQPRDTTAVATARPHEAPAPKSPEKNPNSSSAVGRIQVINRTAAEEAQSVIKEIAADYPDTMKGISEVELLKYHDASEFHRHYGGPKLLAGAYSSTAVAGGRGGMMLWGIYEKWDAGSYLIVYRVQALSKVEGNKICFLDVCHNGGTIASRHPNAEEFKPNTWACMPITLNLKSAKEIEYRLWPDKHTIALDRIYIFRVSSPP
jgi:hypothetical protein